MYHLLRIAVALLGLHLSPAVSLGDTAPLPRSVLILDATEPNSPWGIEFRTVVSSVLSADTVVVYSEVLDLARFNSDEYRQLLGNYLRAKYRERTIGVVVVHGAQALEILMHLRSQLWSAVPVVFANVEETTIAQLNLPPDVTGTILKLRLSSMVAAARVLVPSLKQIALVGDPYERQPFRRHYAQELSQLGKELDIIDLMGLPMGELKGRVAALPADAAIIFTPFYVDRTGAIYVSRDALRQVSEVANRPIVSDVATHIGYGTTGGFVAVPRPVALATADLALRILNGESAASIPITVGDATKPVFDWRQLKRFDINEATLPPGSEVRFREPTTWEQYQWQITLIAAVLFIQTALIINLFYERRRRHLAEVTARNSMAELTHMNRVATAGELSASIAHEVNQPLAGMVARAGAARRWLARETPDIDRARAALEAIESAGHRAGDIVKNVKSMFRKDTAVKSQVDINLLIRTVLELVRIDLQKNRIVLRSQLDHQLPPMLGNDIQLQQVILNLIMNAIDSMRSVQPRVLSVESKLNGRDSVQVTIEDTGIGIDASNVDQIFKPLFTTKEHGMGIGLSICHSIIENHDGRIWVTAGIERGTVFHFELPTKAQAL